MASKKIFTILVVLLLIANIATIAVFWLKKEGSQPPIKGGPAKFIIKELGFTKSQQEQFITLAHEHQDQIRPIREELRTAKDNFFSLLGQPDLNDSSKLAAAKIVSLYTEQIDLITLDHFAKVRAICTATQKKKFDSIIKQVTQMMAMPHHGPDSNGRPPMDGQHDMPPDGQDEMPSQPHP
jgi:protein CpxP